MTCCGSALLNFLLPSYWCLPDMSYLQGSDAQKQASKAGDKAGSATNQAADKAKQATK